MVADNPVNDEQQAKTADKITNTEVPETIHSTLPKYGIVRWKDAVGDKSRKKLDPTSLTRKLAVKETLGWLLQDSEGTIAIIQERDLDKDLKLQRHAEYTLVPRTWIIQIIPLVPLEPISIS